MFKHSTKVPRLYKVSAKIAKDVKEGFGSIKNLVYEHRKKHPNIKAMYALVATLFQKHDEIESLLKKSQFFTKEPRADPWLTKILLVELLWGKKRLAGDSTPEKTVQAYEQIFKAHLVNPPIISEKDDNQGDIKPRYVRVNTLFMSLDEAIEGFQNEGWRLCKFFDKTDYNGFLQKITSLEEDEFLIDIHVPNLLIFPHKTEFYKHPAYQNGSIILQDKASCLPVHILNPPPGSVVLDMCAAPGMKTTQLAAVMNNEGTIYAVERNPKRFETLNKIVEASKATCIKTVNKDVLTCTAADFPNVEYILVDPSCSGSGMTDRLEHEQKVDTERIQNLAGFQIKILRSALNRYGNVKRVVYSTCSMYPEENEDVVRQVLETNNRFKLLPAKQYVNDTWQNFGSSDFGEIGSYCLYAKPNEDFTNGFFVAIFERLENGEENQFFNSKVYNFKRHVQGQENRRKRKQEALENAAENFKSVEVKEEKEKLGEERFFEGGNQSQILSIKEERAEERIEDGIKKETKKKKRDVSVVEVVKTENDVEEYHSKKKNKKERNSTSYIKEEYTEDVRPEEVQVKKKKKSKETCISDDLTILDDDDKEKLNKRKLKTETIEDISEYREEIKQKEEHNESNVVEVIKIKKEKKKKGEIGTNEDLIDRTDDVKEKHGKKKSKKGSNLTNDNAEEIVENNKTEKRRKRSKSVSLEDQLEIDLPKHKPKKKKQEDIGLVEENITSNDIGTEEKRKKKKSKREGNEIENDIEQVEVMVESKKRKKHKKEGIKFNPLDLDNVEDSKNKKLKEKEKYDLEVKYGSIEMIYKEEPNEDIENEVDEKRKKKKKKKSLECDEEIVYEGVKLEDVPLDSITKKKKKHKNKDKLDTDKDSK